MEESVLNSALHSVHAVSLSLLSQRDVGAKPNPKGFLVHALGGILFVTATMKTAQVIVIPHRPAVAWHHFGITGMA